MGVDGLLKRLKEGASVQVNLSASPGSVVADGHFLLHKSSQRSDVAVALVINGEVEPLACAVAEELRPFRESGWRVTIVFDGKTPPAKKQTALARSRARALAKEGVDALRRGEDAGFTVEENMTVSKLAKQAVSFTPQIVAKTAAILQSNKCATCLTAPYEADGQLKVMADAFSSDPTVPCYVYGTDSDLVVLGVPRLLWELNRDPGGRLRIAECIDQDIIMKPPHWILADKVRGKFLRRLHGVSVDDAVNHTYDLLPSPDVRSRLLNFACVAGNDYAKFAGIAAGGASGLVLDGKPRVKTVRDMATAIAKHKKSDISVSDAEGLLLKARCMFMHQIVFDPAAGAHRHLGGTPPTSAAEYTGPMRTQREAMQITLQKISPDTLQLWEPPIGARPYRARTPLSSVDPNGAGNRASRSGGGGDNSNRKQRPSVGSSSKENLPRTDEDFSKWTAQRLKGYLKQFRMLEQSGWSTMPKAGLVKLTQATRRFVAESGLMPSSHLFRPPVDAVGAKSKQARRMSHLRIPTMPDEWRWINDFSVLREHLPEVSELLIVNWLCRGRTVGKEISRVLYRGMQRAMDLGAVDGLRGVPCDEGDNIFWIGLRVHASMRDQYYHVWAALEIESIDAESFSDAEEEENGGDDNSCPQDSIAQERLVASRVLEASCGCTAGEGGGCHHVCMMLQLARLLGMTVRELSEREKDSVTGRRCMWILDHQRGGRNANDNIWWGMTMAEMSTNLRSLRDPKTQGMGQTLDTDPHTSGVAAGNRQNDFNPYPNGDGWTVKRKYFDEDSRISMSEYKAMNEFKDAVRRAKEQKYGNRKKVVLAADLLPPAVRRDPEFKKAKN